jgi:hypothetical protein
MLPSQGSKPMALLSMGMAVFGLRGARRLDISSLVKSYTGLP